MPNITFTISSAHINRLIGAMVKKHKYQEKVENDDGAMIANPESKPAFAKRMIKETLIKEVHRIEHNESLKEIETNDINIDIA